MPTGPTPSLRELCLTRNAELLLALCRAIENECGVFSEPSCAFQVEKLQNYLLVHSGNLINDICAAAHELLHDLSDVRILFSLELHRYVRSFVFQNEVMFGNIGSDTGFWAGQLRKLTNVIVLDIRSLCCTDGIMNVICDNCHQLEEFRFKTHSMVSGPYDENASVTKRGVKRLLELKRLRVVEDVSNFKSLSDTFLKTFFNRLLPRLENFSHRNLQGFLLDNLGDMTSLQLTSLTIHNVRPEYVTTILGLCPRLTSLRLSHLYGGVFDNLTDSPLTLTSFHVDECSGDYVPGLCHFLLNKGDVLTSLVLHTDAIISVNEVILIGECCPYLKHFELNLQVRRPNNPYSSLQVQTDKPIFGSLTSLSLGAPYWSIIDTRIIDLFLRYDSGISSLSLSEIWITLFEKARMVSSPGRAIFPNLTKLSVWINCRAPLRMSASSQMQTLYSGCPKLKYFHLYSDIFEYNRRFDVWRKFFDQEVRLARSRNVRYTFTSLLMD